MECIREKKRTELVLNCDRTYQHIKNNYSDFTEGFWYNKGDTLVLQPNSFVKNETASSSSTKNELILFKFQYKKDKLISLEPKKIRLKKAK